MVINIHGRGRGGVRDARGPTDGRGEEVPRLLRLPPAPPRGANGGVPRPLWQARADPRPDVPLSGPPARGRAPPRAVGLRHGRGAGEQARGDAAEAPRSPHGVGGLPPALTVWHHLLPKNRAWPRSASLGRWRRLPFGIHRRQRKSLLSWEDGRDSRRFGIK